MIRSATPIIGMSVALLVGIVNAVHAQSEGSYPDKPIRFIVPFPPGGNTDLVARAIGLKLTERWGQRVVVDNRAGANTAIGAVAAAGSAPDGYTILFVTKATLSINPNVYAKLPYDAVRDFAPIAPVTRYPYVIAAHPSVPVNTPSQLIALAKATPGVLTYASTGNGSAGHLAGALLETMAGIKMVHVPYKGSAAAGVGLLSGEVMFNIAAMATAVPHFKVGKLKILGVCSEKRLASWPDIPAFGALVKGYEGGTWFGVVTRAGTPRAIIDKLNAGITAAVSSPDVRAQFEPLGLDLYLAKPDEFASFIETDRETIRKVVKASNIRLD